LTYLLLMSSFICSAISKSAGGFLGERADIGCAFDIDFRIASDLALEGERFAFMFEGERGMSGDTALEEGAILIEFSKKSLVFKRPGLLRPQILMVIGRK
jgi:hypothetical protein